MKNELRDRLASGSTRDDIYSKTYYKNVDSMASQSAVAFGEMIAAEFAPSTAVDVGCGTGAMLLDLRRRGIKVLGLEYSQSAITVCRERGLDIREYNIESNPDITAHGRFDVAICTEVAEHVKPEFADNLVNQLTRLSGSIVFTAAVPGQGGGVDHVNEQPRSYWIGKFASRGYDYLVERTIARRRELLNAGVVGFYANNLMLFCDRSPTPGRARGVG